MPSTATQSMPLFDNQVVVVKTPFEIYDTEHPDIWNEFKNIALDLILKDRGHYGAKAIMEVVRYHRAIRGGIEFKVNNSFTASYARKFVAEFPEYANFFELRERKNEQ